MGNRPINRKPWRRAPWRRRLKPGEKGWINGVSTNCGFAPLNGTNDCEDPETAAFGQNKIEIISGAELADHEGNLKILRLVGDVVVVPNEGEPEQISMKLSQTLVRWGLIVVDADMTSGSEVIPFVSPADMVNNADRSWMWMRTDWVQPHTYERDYTEGGTAIYEKSYEDFRFELDVGVQRRLKADQRLVLMAFVVNTGILEPDLGNAIPLAIACNLRAFIAF